MYRSSQRRCSVRKGVLRNFAKFAGKHLYQSLFLLKLQTCNFIKKEALAQVFSKTFAKFLRSPFLQNTSGKLLLNVGSHLADSLIPLTQNHSTVEDLLETVNIIYITSRELLHHGYRFYLFSFILQFTGVHLVKLLT